MLLCALTALLIAHITVSVALAAPEASNGVVVCVSLTATAEQLERALDATDSKVVRGAPLTQSLLVESTQGLSDQRLAALLADSPGVLSAEPNRRVSAQFEPNDEYFGLQWGLSAVNAPRAWEGARGSSTVKIAVVDTGAYFKHPDLAAVLDSVHDHDFVDADAEANDENGHGTHVAGIIGALTNNRTGIASIGGLSGLADGRPGVSVIPVRVLDESGDGWDEDVAAGIRYAAGQGARIINLSVGGNDSYVLREAVEYAQSTGAIVIAAAGNEGDRGVMYPAGYSGVVGVGGITEGLKRMSQSNYGTGLDLVAPGASIYSTWWPSWTGAETYRYMSGTSMATPFVSAAAALVLSVSPSTPAVNVVEALTGSARDLGAPGRDDEYGYGLLDVAGAVQRVNGYDWLAPTTRAQGVESAWSSSDVTVTLVAEDDWTGPAATYYRMNSGDVRQYSRPLIVRQEGRTEFEFWSVDKRGNREDAHRLTVGIDKTVPIARSNAAVSYEGSGMIEISASDGLSGVQSVSWVLDETTEGTGSVVPVTGLGVHTLRFHATDNAGNRSAEKAAAFAVLDPLAKTAVPDEQPPFTIALGAGEGWMRAPVTLHLPATDALGSGVGDTFYRVEGSEPARYEAPLRITHEGTTTISYWSTDRSTPPNVETARTATIRIDSRPPHLGLSSWRDDEACVVVSASATDTVSGVDDASYLYRVDEGRWERGSEVVVAEPGAHVVDWRVWDVAGNETTASLTVKVTTPSSIEIDEAEDAVDWGAALEVSGEVLTPQWWVPYVPGRVQLEVLGQGGTWCKAASARFDELRCFTLRYKPTRRTTYRVRFPGDASLRPSTSLSMTVAPRVKLSAPTIAVGGSGGRRTVTVSGRIVPAHTAGVRVIAQRVYADGRLGETRSARAASSKGGRRWQATFVLGAGKWRIRAYHPQDLQHASTYSASRSLLVR